MTATIRPVVTGTNVRPFWSVMIPTFNGDPRLADTIECVLAQDPGPDEMQIEVVDDDSTYGDPEALTRKVGGGRVSFFRQPTNLGHSGNFNTCIERARGEVVHILHDDDRVRPGFYERLGAPFREDAAIGAAFTRNIYADADGHWRSFSPVERPEAGIIDDWLFRIASGQRTTTPAVVVRRSVYEALGGFDRSVPVGGEDWEMWVRIATRYPVWFEPEPLAIYSMNRPGSLTGAARGTVGLARDMLAMTDTVESYLPRYLSPDRAEHALRHARSMYSSWAIEAAYALARAGERAAALDAAELAFRANRSSTVLRSLARTIVRTRHARGVRA